MSRSDVVERVDAPALALVGGVVVGFEGSWRSRPALWRAVDEAVARGLPLTVLTVVGRDLDPELSAYGRDIAARLGLERATADATGARAEIRRRTPDLAVSVAVVDDADADRLDVSLAGCRLLVLGNQGPHGVQAFLLGTTSRELLRATSCPILVVPEGYRPDHDARTGTVLVGLGDGVDGVGVLRVAAAEAARRGMSLVVLRSYSSGLGAEGPQGLAMAGGQVERQLQEAQLDPGLRRETILTPDPPAESLLLHAGRAELTVIGSRGAIALARLGLGSVSRGVLDAASTPVLVVL